jgi:hypothetical protein
VQPDARYEPEKAEAYRDLISTVTALELADAPLNGPGWVLSLEGEWVNCTMELFGKFPERWAECMVRGEEFVWSADDFEPGGDWLRIVSSNTPIVPSVKGSPILDYAGRAVGIICADQSPFCEQTRLSTQLSEWELKEMDRLFEIQRE